MGDPYGVFVDDDGNGFDGGMGRRAGDGAVIGFAVDPENVVFLLHELMFGRRENAGSDGDLDVVVLEGHEVETEVFDGDGCQLAFPDAFIEGHQGEGGNVVTDILFPDLAEIILFLAKVGEVEVLGKAG